jgi:hypothetical protein
MLHILRATYTTCYIYYVLHILRATYTTCAFSKGKVLCLYQSNLQRDHQQHQPKWQLQSTRRSLRTC